MFRVVVDECAPSAALSPPPGPYACYITKLDTVADVMQLSAHLMHCINAPFEEIFLPGTRAGYMSKMQDNG